MSVLAKRTYKPADERREQILDCALQVFAQKGYHGASVADVCARAGIGRATLYQYFDDKRDVLVALADRIARRVADAVAAREPLRIPDGFVPTEAQAVKFVAACFVEVLSVVFEDAATCRLLLRVGRGADGVVDDMLRAIDASLLAVIEADLAEGQRAGVLRPFDVRFAARFFLGGIEKIVLTYLDEDRPLDVQSIAREAAVLEMLGVLSARPRPETPRPETPAPAPRAAPRKKEGRR
jgi:AcrR family transcriptional regulator